MGLPTGVEVRTESVKSEETGANTADELKPVVTPVETATAATGTVSVDTPEIVEVTKLLCV